jgi:hypothetical protein
MVMIGGSTVVGVFEEGARAEDAVADLERAGFRADQIGIVEPENGGTAGDAAAEDAASGDPGVRIMGAAIGTLLGASSAVLLPGIGPVIAGGALLAPLAGAAVGATAGAVVGSLVDMGLSEPEATYYERQLELGRTVVTVNVAGRYQEAKAVLVRHGAFGIDSTGAGTARYAARSGAVEQAELT